MNHLFVAFDGDDAGQHIGQAVLMDDIDALNETSEKIRQGGALIEEWVKNNGGQMISIGGDEGSFVIDPNLEHELENLRSQYRELTGFSATMGVGARLSEAGKALIAGKLMGKDQIVPYSDEIEDILTQAHRAVHEGTADEEQQKMAEHYIDPTMQDGSDEEMPESEEDMMQAPEESHQDNEQEMMPEDQDIMPDEDSMPEDQDMLAQDQEMAPDQSEDEEMYEEGPDMEMDQDQEDLAEDLGEMPEAPAGEEEMPAQESEFESEEPIHLESKNAATDDGDEEAKADEMIADAADEQPANEEEMPQDPSIEDPQMLEDELGDTDGKEEIMQRIAQNLAAFKENRPLMDQIKQAKPELYQSILGLLQNMIELARMISPESLENEQNPLEEQSANPDEVPEDMVDQAAGEEELPKQNG